MNRSDRLLRRWRLVIAAYAALTTALAIYMVPQFVEGMGIYGSNRSLDIWLSIWMAAIPSFAWICFLCAARLSLGGLLSIVLGILTFLSGAILAVAGKRIRGVADMEFEEWFAKEKSERRRAAGAGSA